MNQVYISLLKSHKAQKLFDLEATQISTTALDMLIEYLGRQTAKNTKEPKWIELTQEVLNNNFTNSNINNAFPLIRFW